MAQKGGTFNFLIQDTKGQPQMVKVVQRNDLPQFKPGQNNLKIIKIPNPGEGNSQGSSVLRTVTLSGIKCSPKVVQLPMEAFQSIQQSVKTEPVDIEDIEIEVPATEEYTYEEVPQEEPVSSSSVTIKSEYPSARRSLTGMRRRCDSDNDHQPEYTTKRRKHADKVGKGLRHFSMKVCEKVRNKGFTSYNEVAEELVVELAAGMRGSSDSQKYDQKNIRRRVYDALNVLMAMNIISKEKKEIRWLGLPTNSVQECNALEKEKQSKMERIQKKSQQLQELLIQLVSFKSLIERNKQSEVKGVKPSPSSAIHLPFIVVNTSDKALIDCSISNDKTEYMFNFNKRFQIHDDIDILKRMGLLSGLDKGECTETDIERIKTMVPKSLENFVEQMGRGSVLNSLESILAEETGSYDEEEEEQDETEVQEQEGNEYSEDSNSDVDV